MPAYKDEKTGKWFAKFLLYELAGNQETEVEKRLRHQKEALGFERDFLEKQSANPDMTFQNLYEIYMEDMAARLKQSTLLTKRRYYRRIFFHFSVTKPINEIKASDVRRWQAKLMSSPNNYSQTYLKRLIRSLTVSSIMPSGSMISTPIPAARQVPLEKQRLREMDYWTYDEYIAFREGVKDKAIIIYLF